MVQCNFLKDGSHQEPYPGKTLMNHNSSMPKCPYRCRSSKQTLVVTNNLGGNLQLSNCLQNQLNRRESMPGTENLAN